MSAERGWGEVATAALILAALCLSVTATAAERRIALTFDDAPRGDGPFFTGEARAEALIAALDEVEAEGAMFFVTTRNLERRGEEGAARLRAYVEAGHVLASHSHAHPWLTRTPVDEYLADLDESMARLEAFDGVLPYFRFPFLDEGRDTRERRDAIRAGLAERGLVNGYVTVDNYDWYLAALASEAVKAGHEFDQEALRNVYVETLVAAVEFYDAIAVEALDRSSAHVLLLHENDLAALFIDDLVRALRERGWAIIPAEVAYQDPLVAIEPDTLFLGQGRVGGIAHEHGRPARELVHEAEDEVFLRDLFVERGLLPAATGE